MGKEEGFSNWGAERFMDGKKWIGALDKPPNGPRSLSCADVYSSIRSIYSIIIRANRINRVAINATRSCYTVVCFRALTHAIYIYFAFFVVDPESITYYY